MSLTPSLPSFSATAKSFWQKTEGKFGMGVLVAIVIAAGVGAWFLLPMLLIMAQNIVELTFLGIVEIVMLGGFLFVATNPTVHCIVKNAFQLSMRWCSSLLWDTDPIGILQNDLDDRRTKLRELDKGVAGCNGAKERLQTDISNNNNLIRKDTAIVQECQRQASPPNMDSLERSRILLRAQAKKEEIGRTMKSNETLTGILNMATRFYNVLCRLQQLSEYDIEKTDSQVKTLKAERNSILAAYKALAPAQRLLKGDPEQLKMVNGAIEYLMEDNSRKMGEIDDFARWTERFLTDMSLEKGADASEAEKMLAQFEQKLLTPGTTDSELIIPGINAVPVGIPLKNGLDTNSNYDNLFK
jgi:hypothetical protein